MKLSAVVNTLNEEENIADCLESLSWADEIVVVDMHSDDHTQEIAKRYTDKIYTHKRMGYVEPARNFAIDKTTGDWIMILDADERVPQSLAAKLIKIAQEKKHDFVRIPRKNLIFDSWIKHSRWWPDYNIRFFKRGQVQWGDEIHSIPFTQGSGIDLKDKEDLAIVHHHYTSISQYLKRLDRYTTVQADQLIEENYQFEWTDLVTKTSSEFLSRFFAGQGYLDGLHGLALSSLQAFSEFVVYLKIWQMQGFKSYSGSSFTDKLFKQFQKVGSDFKYWLTTLKIHQATKKSQRLWLRILRKLGI